MSLIVSLKLSIFSVTSLPESFHTINPPRLDIAPYIQYEIHGVCVQKIVLMIHPIGFETVPP
jgi:hypothetical protein